MRLQQDRSGGAVVDGAVDGSADRRWQRDQDDLVALAVHAQNPVAVAPRRGRSMSAPVASKIRRPSSPSIATRAKSLGLVESPGGGQHGLELQVAQPEGR